MNIMNYPRKIKAAAYSQGSRRFFPFSTETVCLQMRWILRQGQRKGILSAFAARGSWGLPQDRIIGVMAKDLELPSLAACRNNFSVFFPVALKIYMEKTKI